MLDAAALDRLSGPLCDDVMEREGSGERLNDLSRSNLFLIPLDAEQEWYRYHHLLREHLLAELRRRNEPRVRALHTRAAAWHGSRADDESALEYAMLAGDTDQAARLLPQLAQRAYNSGRVGSLSRWFESMDQGGVPQTHSDLAVVGAILFSLLDDVAQAERWSQYVHETPLDSVTDPHATAMLRFGRAFLCRSGVEQMRADAEAALAVFAEDDQWRPLALLTLGAAELRIDRSRPGGCHAAGGRARSAQRRIRPGNGRGHPRLSRRHCDNARRLGRRIPARRRSSRPGGSGPWR